MAKEPKYPSNLQFGDGLTSMDFTRKVNSKIYRCMCVKSYPKYKRKGIKFFIYFN
jgi:hypothetical protein